MTPHRPRRGFTLFQLLVVLIVLALLLALLLPAVAEVRRAAARTQSQHNLKQLGLAVHNYESAFAKLPPGVTKVGLSATALLLPYVEQDNVFRQIDLTKAPDDKANETARNARFKMLISPLDAAPIVGDAGPTNYPFCAGSKADLKGNDGLFFAESVLRIADVTDGLSNTVMVSETLRGDGGVRAMTVARQHVALKADALAGIKPEAGVDDWKADKNIAADRGASWMDGKFLQGSFTATLAVNDDKPDVTCAGLGGLSGTRTLSGGFAVAFGDGAVRWMKADVKLKTWQALCTRNGGEAINPND